MVLPQAALGILQVEAGAECFRTAGEHDDRGFAIILEAARGVG